MSAPGPLPDPFTGEPGRRGADRRWWWLAAGVVVLIAVIAAVIVAQNDDDDDGTAAPPTTGSTAVTASPSSSTSTASSMTTPPASMPAETAAAMWPFPGSDTHYADPADAARSFATDFLHFDDPRIGAFQAGDGRSGEVPVRPQEGAFVTTVLVRRLGAGTDWSVVGATTDDIDVTAPTAGTAVTSPVQVAGQAVAFEGNVQVEVREDGAAEAVGRGFVTGGGDVKRPFTGSIAFDPPRSPYGVVVFFTRSAKDGSVQWAEAVRVAFGSPGGAGTAPT